MTLSLPLTDPARAASYRAAGQWRDVTIAQLFVQTAERLPQKTAIVIDQQRISYAAMLRDVSSVAGGLLELGLKPGDVVAAQLPNSYEIPLLHLACNMAGLLFMPLHDSWRALEIEHLLRRAHVKVVITPAVYRDFDHLAMINDLRGELPSLAAHYIAGDSPVGALDFADLLLSAPLSGDAIETHRPDPDLPAAIMLSGGTTAISKISRYSSNNLIAMLDLARDAVGFSEDDVAAALAPAGTGATGYVYPVLMPLLNGATSVILSKWGDAAEAVDMVIRERCTYAVAIPAQLAKLVPALEKRTAAELSDLRVITNAGAPLPYETATQVERLTGAIVQSIYGATDGGTPTMTRIDDPVDKRLTSVGRVVRGCECELRGDDGSRAAAGQSGEILWRGADKSWGYLGDDQQTAEAFTEDQFYRSGDLGQFDDDGYLRIVGRIKDMILRGGRNISPLVIEEALARHPDVEDVAVVAIADPVLGERACAVLITRNDADLALEDAVSFLKSQGLAVWQLPERIEIVDLFPRSAGGKTLKRDLAELVKQRMEA